MKAISNATLSQAVGRAHEALGAKLIERWGRWTPQDLRRTMRTGLSACKVPLDVAELTIGHTKRGIVAVYDQHGFDDERRFALQLWEMRLLAIVAGRDPDAVDSRNVVQIAEARA